MSVFANIYFQNNFTIKLFTNVSEKLYHDLCKHQLWLFFGNQVIFCGEKCWKEQSLNDMQFRGI